MPSAECHNERHRTKSGKWRLTRSGLLHDPSTEPLIFLTGNRIRIFQPFELLDLIGRAEADHLTKLIACLLGPFAMMSASANLSLRSSLRHTAAEEGLVATLQEMPGFE
jgi:hypothetical protein